MMNKIRYWFLDDIEKQVYDRIVNTGIVDSSNSRWGVITIRLNDGILIEFDEDRYLTCISIDKSDYIAMSGTFMRMLHSLFKQYKKDKEIAQNLIYKQEYVKTLNKFIDTENKERKQGN